MKDAFYFTTSATENEHFFIEEFLREALEKDGYKLLYYRKFKNGHVPMKREAKTNAPRWVVLDICREQGLDIESGGFYYKRGIVDHEVS